MNAKHVYANRILLSMANVSDIPTILGTLVSKF
jgi:hypothetical protein